MEPDTWNTADQRKSGTTSPRVINFFFWTVFYFHDGQRSSDLMSRPPTSRIWSETRFILSTEDQNQLTPAFWWVAALMQVVIYSINITFQVFSIACCDSECAVYFLTVKCNLLPDSKGVNSEIEAKVYPVWEENWFWQSLSCKYTHGLNLLQEKKSINK